MPRALVTKAVLGEPSTDHPITRRDHASRTTAQSTLPSLVGCSVTSVTHSSSGLSRWNCRSTRSAAVTTPGTRRNFGRPESPGCRLDASAAPPLGVRPRRLAPTSVRHELVECHRCLARRNVRVGSSRSAMRAGRIAQTAAASVLRSSRTPKPGARGRRASPEAPRWPSPRLPRTFWG